MWWWMVGSLRRSGAMRLILASAVLTRAKTASPTASGPPTTHRPERWNVRSENMRTRLAPGTEVAAEAISRRSFGSRPSCTFAKQTTALRIPPVGLQSTRKKTFPVPLLNLRRHSFATDGGGWVAIGAAQPRRVRAMRQTRAEAAISRPRGADPAPCPEPCDEMRRGRLSARSAPHRSTRAHRRCRISLRRRLTATMM